MRRGPNPTDPRRIDAARTLAVLAGAWLGAAWPLGVIAGDFHPTFVAPGLFVSGEPTTDDDFREAAALGVRLVVSVDGLPPDVQAARRAGLRYVHLPMGYDEIDAGTRRALEVIAVEANGPVLVHCHHGKHRGPAAAAVLGRAMGALDAAAAVETLRRCGTGAQYGGLWRDVAAYTPASHDGPLNGDARRVILDDLPEVAEVDAMALAMAQLDRALERLAGPAGAEIDDNTAREAAALVAEGFRESARAAEAARLDPALRAALAEAAADAERLDRTVARTGAAPAESLARLTARCAACHAEWRDGGNATERGK